MLGKRSLNDCNYGFVELKTSDMPDGVWRKAVFNVRDIPDFTLLVVIPKYCDNKFRTPVFFYK